MTQRLRIGISTCPNDTFTFCALLERRIAVPGVELAFELDDVQALNERFLAGQLDVAKVSFHAALLAGAAAVVLPTGSALGFGVGPLLLAARGRADAERPRVLAPGATTTATLLWRLFHGERAEPEQVPFSRILPSLERAEADLGVCIHEGRFTWERYGLELVEDLGERWEREMSAPLPLGGIVARRELGDTTIGALQEALARSLDWAWSHRDDCLPTMRTHAQELESDVLWSHVDLYVNEWTRELGSQGRQALRALATRAAERELIPPSAGATGLEVFG